MPNTTFKPSANSPAAIKLTIRIILSLFVLLILFVLFLDSFRVNSPTQVSVVTTLGKISSIQGSVAYFKVPLFARSVVYDTSVQSIECVDGIGKETCKTLDAGTKDLQSVKVAVQVSYRIDSTKPEEIYRLVQDQATFNTVIVPSSVEEALKVTTAKYSGEELIVKRSEVKTMLEKELQTRLSEFYLKVVAVNIVNFQFSPSYQQEIDKKVATQQQTLQKQEELKRVEAEAKIKVTQAQAEADAIRLQGDVLRQNPEVLQLEKIKKWDGKLPQVQGNDGLIISLPKDEVKK